MQPWESSMAKKKGASPEGDAPEIGLTPKIETTR
jgi:hypothetical protein